jgi:hypothetical protein
MIALQFIERVPINAQPAREAGLAHHVAIGIDPRPGSVHSAPLARETIAWEDHQCSSLPAS